jgi:lysozyme
MILGEIRDAERAKPMNSESAARKACKKPLAPWRWETRLQTLPRLFAFAVATFAALALPAVDAAEPGGPYGANGPSGLDVSWFQDKVPWQSVVDSGSSFVYVRATEGIDTKSPTFGDQSEGSAKAGLFRGAYHIALPDRSNGAAQADFFMENGGGWTADDQTLPGAVSIDYNPHGEMCYGLKPEELVAWLHDFADEYRGQTGRDVVIYTSADYWDRCTGGSTEFGSENPLWVAQYGGNEPTLPAGWSSYTFWQFSPAGLVPGLFGQVDQDLYNGDESDLLNFANNTQP